MLRDLILDLTPNLLGQIFFRTGVDLIHARKTPIATEDLRRICVFATSGIGNLVLLIPMLRQLRAKLPEAQVDLIVLDHPVQELLDSTDLVDQIWVMSDTKRLWRELRSEWYDLAIAATHRGFMRAKQVFRVGARYRIGFRYDYRTRSNADFFLTHAVDYEEGVHEVELGMRLLAPLGMTGKPDLQIPLSNQERQTARSHLGGKDTPWVALHPTSPNEPRKAWPLDRYRSLMERIQREAGTRMVLVGGPADQALLAPLAQATGALLLAGQLTLRETAAVIEQCQLFIGNDGAPMHLAASVQTPVVAFFGPTDPQIYGPYGEKHTVLRSSLDCSPCHKPHSGRFACDTNACLETISIKDAWEAVQANV